MKMHHEKKTISTVQQQAVEHLQASNERRKKLRRLWRILQCDKSEQKYVKSAIGDLQVLCHGALQM